MKTKTHITLILVALLAYWVGLCNASAFYDPGTQRWLNRDPIAERGGINLFDFVRNRPISGRDAFGLIGFPPTPCEAAQAALAAAEDEADEEIDEYGSVSPATLNAINAAKAAVNANCPDKPKPPQPPNTCPAPWPVPPMPVPGHSGPGLFSGVLTGIGIIIIGILGGLAAA